MSVHTVGGALLFLFGLLLIIVGAVFYTKDKVNSYNGAIHVTIFALGSLLLLGGSGWFWGSFGL